MSLMSVPSFNIGASVNVPGMNPSIGLPAGGSVGLGMPNQNLAPIAPSAPAAPMGDWRTPLGLTANWGNINAPLLSQFINPSPFTQTLASLNPTYSMKPPAYTPPPKFDPTVGKSLTNEEMLQFINGMNTVVNNSVKNNDKTGLNALNFMAAGAAPALAPAVKPALTPTVKPTVTPVAKPVAAKPVATPTVKAAK